MQLILIANIILSIGAIIGISVFASQTGDIYILSDTYGFYWFLSTVSFIFGIWGYVYHKIDYVKDQFPKSEYSIYGMTFISLLFTVFLLAVSASMSSILRNCLYIKNLIYPNYDDLVYSYNYTCRGEIITTSFGFSLFVLWFIITCITGEKLYSKLQNDKIPEIPDTVEMKENAQVIQLEEEQQKVQTEQP